MPRLPCQPPGAWVLRCPACTGGLVYALATPDTAVMLQEARRHPLYGPSQIEHGPIDRLWEIDYCTCKEPEP